MADATVIKEFFVRLGFKSDETSLKNFEVGITKASTAVLGLAAAIEATAVTIAAGVARWTSNLESLYFAAQRTASSANELKLVDRATQNIGFSAGEAEASIEALNEKIRQVPGLLGVLNSSLHVALKYNKDGSVDAADAWIKAVRSIKQMYGSPLQQYMAYQYGGMLGISPHTMTKLLSGDIEDALRRVTQAMGDADWGKMSDDSHRFMNNLRDSVTIFESIGSQVADNFLRKFGFKDLENFNLWLEQHRGQIVDKINSVIDAILAAKEKIESTIKFVVDKFRDANAATGGWLGTMLTVGLVLKTFGGFEIISGVMKLTSAFARLAWTIGTVGTAANAASAAGAGGGLLAALGRLAIGGLGAGAFGAMLAGVGTAGYAAYKASKNEDASNWLSNGADWIVSKLSKGRAGGLGDWLYGGFNANKEAMTQLQMQGWTEAQARGILANLSAESNGQANATGDNGHAYGLAQWHEDRQALFKKVFGMDIHNADWSKQLEFVNWELHHNEKAAGDLLRAATNAQQATRIVSLAYERPAGGVAEANRRAATVVNLKTETTVHVDGALDAAETARRVGNEQKRVNAELVRNFIPAVL